MTTNSIPTLGKGQRTYGNAVPTIPMWQKPRKDRKFWEVDCGATRTGGRVEKGLEADLLLRAGPMTAKGRAQPTIKLLRRLMLSPLTTSIRLG